MMASVVEKNEKYIAEKLHRQFCHPSSEKLIRLIRNTSIKNKKKLEKEIRSTTENCITCLKFKKRIPRPVVCFPMATTFNEAVAMDLKVWGKKYFLVMADMATRFCTASVITNKLPATIIKSFIISWISLFGAPKKIFTDMGGEFNNNEMRVLSEMFNITVKTTAAESPWSNGIVERLNGVLGKLVNKILDDTNCDIRTAVAWAVAARNAFHNKSGYSPNQLVFGYNPAIPDIFTSDLPGLQNVTSSDIVKKNLEAMHKARQEFIKFESDERYKQALRHNVNTTDINKIKDGDEVYYKRNERDEWHGPGKVIDIEGKTVIVKHGGACVKVHEVSLRKKPHETRSDNLKPSVSNEYDSATSSNNQDFGEPSGARSLIKNSSICNPEENSTASGGFGPRADGSVGGVSEAHKHLESAIARRDLDIETDGVGFLLNDSSKVHVFDRSARTKGGQEPRAKDSVENACSQFENTTASKCKFLEEYGGAVSSSKNNNNLNFELSLHGRSHAYHKSTNENMLVETEETLKPGTNDNNEEVANQKGKGKQCKIRVEDKSRVWKKGERFQGIDSETGEYISGKIMYRAGKVTGTNKDYYNIERDSDGWQGCINMTKIKDLSLVPEETEVIILLNNNEVYLAKLKEIQNWLDNDVFEEVPNNNQKALSVRWVVTDKNGDKKARLVVRGYEEDTSNLRKESPTCSREAIRILILIASSKGWGCHTVDVKAAYLQGDAIERKIYLRPPPEFDNGYLWKLKKTVYGLCDAARAWYFKVKDELSSLSVQMCDLDNSLFFWYNKGNLEGIICIYVDDFLWSGTRQFEEEVIKKLKGKFLIGISASISFTYVGLSIKSYDDGITIDQTHYIASLNPIPISRSRSSQKGSLLTESEKIAYRALVGQLIWIATHTRPDISFETCERSVSFKNATVADLLQLNKLVFRVKSSNVNLFFPKLKSLEKCTLECYADAAFKNLPTKRSQGGLIIFLKDELGQRCPLLWQSKKLERVADSTLTAETLALLEGAKISIYLAAIFKQILGDVKLNIKCFTDNKSLSDSLVSLKQVKDHRLRLEATVLRQMLQREEIMEVTWVNSSEQLADCLTKKGVCIDKLQNAISRE